MNKILQFLNILLENMKFFAIIFATISVFYIIFHISIALFFIISTLILLSAIGEMIDVKK